MNNLPAIIRKNISDEVIQIDQNISLSNNNIKYEELLFITQKYFDDIKNKIIDKLTREKQQNFHNSLSFFDKYIYKNKIKENNFKEDLNTDIHIINTSISIGIALARSFANNWSKLHKKYIVIPKMLKSLIINSMYINNSSWASENKGIPLRNHMYLSSVLRMYGYTNPENQLDKFIDAYDKKPNYIQPPNDFLAISNNNIEPSYYYYSILLKQSDPNELSNENSSTYNNAVLLGKNVLGLRDEEIKSLINNAIANNNLISTIVNIPTFFINDFFKDLIEQVECSKERIDILIESDPFKCKRDLNKSNLKQGVSIIGLAALTYASGGTYDFLAVLAAPILMKAFEDGDSKLKTEVENRFWECWNNNKKNKLSKSK